MSARHPCEGAKFVDDHSTMGTDGVRRWRCAGCGTIAPWGPSWGSQGILECPDCGRQHVDFVACSNACAVKVGASPREPPKRSTRERGRTKDRAACVYAVAQQLAALTPEERAEAVRQAEDLAWVAS